MLRLSNIAALAAAFSVFSTCIPAGAGLKPSREEASCASGKGVPHLDGEAVAWLKGRGIEIRALDKLGAEVLGLDLRSTSKGKDDELLQVLQKQMAARGYLVFRGQGVLTGDEQVRASELFGGREIHSTHGVHPKAPNEHIFRLSNDQEHGILGVGDSFPIAICPCQCASCSDGFHLLNLSLSLSASRSGHSGTTTV